MQIQELSNNLNLQGEEKTEWNMVLNERLEGKLKSGESRGWRCNLTAGFVAAGFEREEIGTFTFKTLDFCYEVFKLK